MPKWAISLIFAKKRQKQYIYIVYILYKRKKCKNGKVSYGYHMGIVWVSYGETRFYPGCSHVAHREMKKRAAFEVALFGNELAFDGQYESVLLFLVLQLLYFGKVQFEIDYVA